MTVKLRGYKVNALTRKLMIPRNNRIKRFTKKQVHKETPGS